VRSDRWSDEAYLFVGQSGAEAGRWLALWLAEPGAVISVDARVVLPSSDGVLDVPGTPWHGVRTASQSARAAARLAPLFLSPDDTCNAITAVSGSRCGVPSVLPRVFLRSTAHPQLILSPSAHRDHHTTRVPCVELGFTRALRRLSSSLFHGALTLFEITRRTLTIASTDRWSTNNNLAHSCGSSSDL